MAPVFLLCDPADIGISERIRDPHFEIPALYCFDRYPGGSGISEGFSAELGPIVHGAYDLVSQCSCQSGCPSCIGPIESEESGSKEEVIRFFQTWLVESQQQ